MGKYISNHKWYRAVKRGMREAQKQKRRNAAYGIEEDKQELNALGKWFERQGWKGELLKFVLTLSVLAILWFTHTWLVFLMLCGIVWFVKTLFF